MNYMQLPPLLDEFKIALLDEIEVAQRNASSNAIPLSNGHRIGQEGGAFQYAFLIDSVLNTPDGTPGDLIVPGKAPIAITIVSIEGLRISISIECDLGKYVPNARLQTNLTILMRKLIERLETIGYSRNYAAERMLGEGVVDGKTIKQEGNTQLNERQLLALESALGRNLTIIWGPPGTGKTFTIGTIAEYLHKFKRSVLIVSHTNTAVDQAIKHVAEKMVNYLDHGKVIRVGEIRDEVLKAKYPDIILKKQVEKQSKETVAERDRLVFRQQEIDSKLNTIIIQISKIKWINSTKSELEILNSLYYKLIDQEQEYESFKNTFDEIDENYNELEKIFDQTSKIISVRERLNTLSEEYEQIRKKISENHFSIEDLKNKIEKQNNKITIAERIIPLKQEFNSYPSQKEQKINIENLSLKLIKIEEKLEDTKKEYIKANAILKETSKVNAFTRVLKKLPNPYNQRNIVNNLSLQISVCQTELEATIEAKKATVNKLSRIIELENELSRFNHIGEYLDEQNNKIIFEKELHNHQRIIEKNKPILNKKQKEINDLVLAEKELAKLINGDVLEINNSIFSKLEHHKELQNTLKSIRDKILKLKNTISDSVSSIIAQLQKWDVNVQIPNEIKDKISLVIKEHQRINDSCIGTEISTLLKEENVLRIENRRITNEIAAIDSRLAQMEREIILKATIVGATLTKTYLSDDIHARKFDTVILDEASMAPIPALWVAAYLSEKNLVIVGDFKQLPPIVLSSNKLTTKWLGRDIFEASGITQLWEQGTPPEYFIQLNEQRRMLLKIAELTNLFYDGRLKTGNNHNQDNSFNEWYNINWGQFDNEVVLVDTGSLNAWVTSVVKGGNSSRLNFLSATVSVDLAEQLLQSQRPVQEEGSPKRILIIAPYRAHAKLVSILLRENVNMHDEVIAGTVHSFQGSEASVVIFDLVVDEPHYKVNQFMPSLDDELKRLYTVGLTRAKFRLFIVGDFEYCLSRSRKAFLGRELLPFLLKSYPKIDASLLFPEGLAAKAAKAQMTMLGGAIEISSDRIVVTQADFYRILSTDLSKAVNQVIIYSPFITQDRVSFLLPQLREAKSRNVSIFIITKCHSERQKEEEKRIIELEKFLTEEGIIIIHKLRMHEKLVFIDDSIVWSGSLNPLSFSNTQEIMERRYSKSVFEDYFKILRIKELLEVQTSEEKKCPICGSEIIAIEGADQPFYWSCVNKDCYTRSITQPYPYNGVFTCRICNAPLEFGYWGNKPHWRCTANNRHRQKLYKSHLRLPKMASLVPPQEIENILGGINYNHRDSQLDIFDNA